MARPAYGGRTTCESRKSIDVRRWHREGVLRAGAYFSQPWTFGEEPFGSIGVRVEPEEVILLYQWQSSEDAEWKPVEQRVPIAWTACHLGGRRPWFVCLANSRGRFCGRRVAVLYLAGESFACRRCYGLAYASQQKSPTFRAIFRADRRASKIRMQLGGSASLFDPFPEKPPRMHWRKYLRLRTQAQEEEDASSASLLQWALDRTSERRS